MPGNKRAPRPVPTGRAAKPLEDEERHRESCREHPVQGKLVSTLFRRSEHWLGCARQAKSNSERVRVLRQLRHEIEELSSWLAPALAPSPESERRRLLNDYNRMFEETGFSVAHALPFLQQIDKACRARPRGRPATRKTLAVRAYEMKLANTRLSWTKLTQEICPCGEPQHGFRCREKIRQEVNVLKRFLRKYQLKPSKPAK